MNVIVYFITQSMQFIHCFFLLLAHGLSCFRKFYTTIVSGVTNSLTLLQTEVEK